MSSVFALSCSAIAAMIKEDDFLIARKNEYFKTLRLSSERLETIDGEKVCLKNAVGLPYGTTFVAIKGRAEPILPGDEIKHICLGMDHSPPSLLTMGESSKDNRDIFDSTTNQRLDYEDIKSLQQSGATPEEIMGTLARGNSNFDKKTKFSQEKYFTKKSKRHLNLFSLERPSTRILCDLHCRLRRTKCLGLRFDTVCHILTYANIYAGSTVLLAETCGGLLLSAILERLRSSEVRGSVLQFYHGSCPQRPEINPVAASTYDEQVYSISLRDTMDLLKNPKKLLGASEAAIAGNSEQRSNDAGNAEMNENTPANDDTAENGSCTTTVLSAKDDPMASDEASVRRIIKSKKKLAAYRKLVGESASVPDAMIVATRFHPVDLTLLLLQFMPIGKPVVVYSQYLQPLVDLFNALKQRGGVIYLRLTDSLFRPIQVLPERTHPEMSIQASGGYLLCGYTAEPSPTLEELLQSGLLASSSQGAFSWKNSSIEGIVQS